MSLPLVLQGRVHDGVAPGSASPDVVPDPALLDHSGDQHRQLGGGVGRGAGAPDAVQAQVAEAERQDQPDQVGADAPAPVVGAEPEADLRAVRVVGLDVQPGDAEGLAACRGRSPRARRDAGARSRADSSASTIDLLDLLACAGVERQVFGGGGVAVYRVQGVHVLDGDFPQPESPTRDLNVAHAQTLTPRKSQGQRSFQ